MGRYISCEIKGESKSVYKYVLGEQSSEMNRISGELGIGEYHLIRYVYNEDEKHEECGERLSYEYIDEQSEEVEGDILILIRSHIEKLNEKIDILEANQKSQEDEFYIDMTKAIRDFMLEYPEENRFIFIEPI